MREQMTEPREYYDEPEGDGYDWDYEPEDHGQRPKILWGRVLSLVIFMLLAFFLGRSMAGSDDGVTQDDVDDVQAELNSLKTTNETLEARVSDLQAQIQTLRESGGTDPEDEEPNDEPVQTETYIVKPGDTLDEIVQKHYGCLTTKNYDITKELVLPASAITDPTAISPGDEIDLPKLPDGESCS